MKKANFLIPVLILTLVCAGCQKEPEEPVESVDSSVYLKDETEWGGTVKYNGVKYRRRTDVRTVLFLGVDNTYLSESGENLVGNNGRTDAIMLFLVDTKSKTTELLTVSRDTMTEVDMYDGVGNLIYSRPMHINLQYSFGNSPKRSCFLTQRTVSELLYNARIDGYFALTMDGIPAIVEELGGITITMPDDYTKIDSRYTKGATVTMNGDEAERFARYRDTSEFGSNEGRNERHSWFVMEMFRQLKAKGDLDGTVERILDVAEDYIETDIDAETLKLLAGSTMTESYKVPGEVRQGKYFNEYYVDEDGLRELVIKLFYRPVE